MAVRRVICILLWLIAIVLVAMMCADAPRADSQQPTPAPTSTYIQFQDRVLVLYYHDDKRGAFCWLTINQNAISCLPDSVLTVEGKK